MVIIQHFAKNKSALKINMNTNLNTKFNYKED